MKKCDLCGEEMFVGWKTRYTQDGVITYCSEACYCINRKMGVRQGRMPE